MSLPHGGSLEFFAFAYHAALAGLLWENAKAAEENLALTRRRQQNGLTTELDVDQSRTLLDDTRRQLPAYDGQVQQAMNALSVLISEAPGAVDEQLRETKPVPAIPTVAGVGVPSSLAGDARTSAKPRRRYTPPLRMLARRWPAFILISR